MQNYGGNVDLMRFNVNGMKKQLRWPCYHLWLAPAVSYQGKFLLCCSDPHQKEVFGDINRDMIAGCWKALSKVRESHLQGKFTGICTNCDTWREYPNLFFGHEYGSNPATS